MFVNTIESFISQWLYRMFIMLSGLLPGLLQAQEQGTLSWPPLHLPAYTMADSIAVSSWIKRGSIQEGRSADSALYWFNKAYVRSRNVGYTNGIVSSLYYIGSIYAKQGDLDTSLYILRFALHFCTINNNPKAIIMLTGNVGIIYFLKGEYPKAAAYYDSTLKISRKLKGYEEMVVHTMINLGAIYLRLNEPEKALRYLEEGENICRRSNYMHHLSLMLNNKGEAYVALHQPEKAKETFMEQLIIAEKANSEIGMITAYNSLGTLFLQQGKPKDAIIRLKEAELRMDPHNPLHASINVRKNLGMAYLGLKQYTNAEQQLKTALEYATKQDVKNELPEILKSLKSLYKATGNYREAFESQEQYEQLKDSMFAREKVKDVNELDIKYRTAEKEKQLVLERDKVRQREQKLREKNFWIAGIGLGSVLLTALFIMFYRNVRHRQMVAQQSLAMERLQATIEGEEKERSRMARELHDGIGSMLASIKMNLGGVRKIYPSPGGATQLDRIAQMLEDTTAEVRKTAHNLMPDVLTRHNLEEALALFCERVNAGGSLNLELECYGLDKPLDKAVELMLYRTVQELIQNIIKHSGATYALIQVMLSDDVLGITAEDNGAGFEISENGVLAGLDNLRFRIQALQGNIDVYSRKGEGTMVHIEFDVPKLKIS